MTTTKAAVLIKQKEDLLIEELIIPELLSGQVLVKIHSSSICRTQLNEILGLKGEDPYIPHTLGHEGAGIIEKIGPNVTKIKQGDRVVLTWIKGEGADTPGAVYKRKDGTKVNSGAISTFMTKAVIAENRVVKIPAEIDFDIASLLGCAIPTGAGIVKNSAKINASSSIIVFGTGGVGMSSVIAAKMLNAKLIVAVDINQKKLELAKELGADYIINPNSDELQAKVAELTKSQGFDYAIEATGITQIMEDAFLSVKNLGGLCILAGNPKVGNKISLDPFDLIKGKNIIGSWGGATKPDSDIPFYIEAFMNGKLPIEKLISHKFLLDDINKAIKVLEKGDCTRILIEM